MLKYFLTKKLLVLVLVTHIISSDSANRRKSSRATPSTQIFSKESVNPTHNKQNLPTSKTIIGGRPTRVGEAPYHLSVRLDGEHICGASLLLSPVGTQFVVTAGHCTHFPDSSENVPLELLTVVAGSIIYNDTSYPAQEIRVRRVLRHNSYMNEQFPRNDIALLFLNHGFKLNSVIRPIKLPSAEEEYTGNILKVTGWGAVSQSMPDLDPVFPKFLQAANFPIIDLQKCEASHPNMVLTTNICAGYFSGAITPCFGDSGGPAIGDASGRDSFRDKRDWVLVGIVSWGGSVCASPNSFDVYTRVSSYKSWIVRNAVTTSSGSG